MGCNISSLCPIPDSSSKEEVNNEEHPITTFKNITSRSNIQDQPTADTNRQRPMIKHLNFQSLIFPPVSSERSNVSYHNSEVKDKVVSLISSRHGKSFLTLLKQINFSVKIIQKIDKKKSELNTSLNSLQSKESNLSFTSFKIINQNKTNNNSLSEECSNILKLKNLFYLPLISINGDIETSFEIAKNDISFSFSSFSVLFDYFDSFFNFLINLFQNYNYNNFKESMVHIASFASDIQKIKLNYYPECNKTGMNLYYMSDEFYSQSLGKGIMTEPNSNKLQKEYLGFIYNAESTPLFEIGYKNISLTSNECYSVISKYITSLPFNKQYNIFINEYLKDIRYTKRIVMFSIIYKLSEGNLICNGITVKQIANSQTTNESNNNTNPSGLKVNDKIAHVRYQNISIRPESIAISYEYHYT